jgi:malonate-semialdehyde dehydrogenase (acetylating)/methylmalonate-semialdehyde dehydrogenase
VAAAREALPAWRAVVVPERARLLFALREGLAARREELARSVTTEMGKTIIDARAEVARMIEMVECACAIPTTMQGRLLENVSRNVDCETIRQPVGVCAAIVPFNFPAMVPFWFLPFAIGCGNTFILKPSEQVPLTQQIAFEVLHELGLPPGVVNLVNGSREVVEGIVDHPGIDAVSFVGSAPVARLVYERAARAGKRVQALGGAKNHMVVMPDAVIDQTVKGIIGSAFGAAGQRCMAGSVVVTVGDAHERLMPALREATEALAIGDGLDERTEVGPVISCAARDRITGWIERAAQDGATVLVDGRLESGNGRAPDGAFVGPTILDDVAPDAPIVGEEVFGPVLAVVRAASLDEAIQVVNRSRFGNGTSIFTENGSAVRRFRHEVQAGMIGVNIGVAAPVAFFPFSGWKDSFLGDLHAHGPDAVEFYTRKKTVTSRWFSNDQASATYFVEN